MGTAMTKDPKVAQAGSAGRGVSIDVFTAAGFFEHKISWTEGSTIVKLLWNANEELVVVACDDMPCLTAPHHSTPGAFRFLPHSRMYFVQARVRGRVYDVLCNVLLLHQRIHVWWWLPSAWLTATNTASVNPAIPHGNGSSAVQMGADPVKSKWERIQSSQMVALRVTLCRCSHRVPDIRHGRVKAEADGWNADRSI
jgi:hypothetical protein